MTANLSRWGKALFPEIRLSIRTSLRRRDVLLSPAWQATGLVAIVALLCGLAGFGGWRLAARRAEAEREAAVVRIESANVDLQEALAKSRDQLALATRNLGEAQERQASLASQSDQLRGELQATEAKLSTLGDTHQQSTAQSLADAQQQISRLQAERATLSARLNKVEGDKAQQQDQVTQYKGDLDRMRARLDELQKHASASNPWRPVVATYDGADRVVGPGSPGLGAVERVLAAAGVDVGRLFGELHSGRGDEGGPFLPPPKSGRPEGQVDGAQLAALRKVADTLPLSLPMDSYRMTSPFGMRRDPFNGRPAFHPGIDLAAPYGTPVYATAPGIVTFAGWMSGYGKTIDIDDGHGISTRYGHLHGFTVAVGEQVKTGNQIGYEGSSGRSTGPHVIYEVRVHGQPQDPMKFVELGQMIPASAH